MDNSGQVYNIYPIQCSRALYFCTRSNEPNDSCHIDAREYALDSAYYYRVRQYRSTDPGPFTQIGKHGSATMIFIIFSLECGHILPFVTKLVLGIESLIMSALYLLIIVSIAVAAVFLGAFIWSVRSDQFEDKEGSAFRMLFEEETRTNK